MDSMWLRGWDDICKYLGGIHKETARRWVRKYGMPIRRAPGNIPIALPAELDIWVITFDELKKKEKKKRRNKG